MAHPWMKLGGSEVRTLWLLWALRQAGHSPTLLTMASDSLESLNQLHATPLRSADFIWRRVVPPWRGHGLRRLNLRWFERACSRQAGRYDLFVSAYNPVDVGRPSLCFVADFSWDHRLRQHLDGVSPPWAPRQWLNNCYHMLLAGRPAQKWLHQHYLVANSNWTQEILQREFGVRAQCVIAPPVSRWVSHSFSEGAAARLEFLWMGRITPEKRLQDAVAILEAVRGMGLPVQLHVAGEWENSSERSVFMARHGSKAWLTWHGRADALTKEGLLERCAFGIHTRRQEPFGISVAEMMAAGCLVFAPRGGAPAELLAGTGLTFGDSIDGAASVILDMLKAPFARHQEVSRILQARASAFAPSAFCQRVTDLVAQLQQAGLTRQVIPEMPRKR